MEALETSVTITDKIEAIRRHELQVRSNSIKANSFLQDSRWMCEEFLEEGVIERHSPTRVATALLAVTGIGFIALGFIETISRKGGIHVWETSDKKIWAMRPGIDIVSISSGLLPANSSIVVSVNSLEQYLTLYPKGGGIIAERDTERFRTATLEDAASWHTLLSALKEETTSRASRNP